MIVVIQCAGTKRRDAGYLRAKNGSKVLFVARPQIAPPSAECIHAHPDDPNEDGVSWRDQLISYNTAPSNPLALSTAFELYEPPAAPDIYRRLVRRLGIKNVFILSAGWGLIEAGFRIPCYDVTFASEVKKSAPWKYRHTRL